eukprot:4640481-Prymnesium_polylepis.1
MTTKSIIVRRTRVENAVVAPDAEGAALSGYVVKPRLTPVSWNSLDGRSSPCPTPVPSSALCGRSCASSGLGPCPPRSAATV